MNGLSDVSNSQMKNCFVIELVGQAAFFIPFSISQMWNIAGFVEYKVNLISNSNLRAASHWNK